MNDEKYIFEAAFHYCSAKLSDITLMNAGKYMHVIYISLVCVQFNFHVPLLIFIYKCLGISPFPLMPIKELANFIIASMNASTCKEVDEPLYKCHLALFVSNNEVV